MSNTNTSKNNICDKINKINKQYDNIDCICTLVYTVDCQNDFLICQCSVVYCVNEHHEQPVNSTITKF